jgi:hypothetical protein
MSNIPNALSLIPKSSSIKGKEKIENKKRKSITKFVTVKKGRGNIEIILNNSSITNVNILQQHKGQNDEEKGSDDEDDVSDESDESDDEDDEKDERNDEEANYNSF